MEKMKFDVMPKVLRYLSPKLSSATTLLVLLGVLISAPIEAKSPKAVTPEASGQRIASYSFKQLGASTPIRLRGVDGSIALPFAIRSDEVVASAKLKFDYSYSPALLAELSHLKVMLNDEVIAVLPLPREKGVPNRREIDLDPRFFTDYNKLQFRLIGHYTYKCEDPLHSSLWLELSNLGRLELTLAPLALTNDLKYLPLPFFEKRDNATLKIINENAWR